MSGIEFSRGEKDVLVAKVKRHFQDELDQDIGQFDAEFLLDFFAEHMGAYFYNRGLYDAQALLEDRFEGLKDAIFEIEKPTDFRR